MRSMFFALCCAATISAVSSSAVATTLSAQPIESLARGADAVVAGTVLSLESMYVDGRIVTVVEVSVDDVWKGGDAEIALAGSIEIVRYGGRVGDVTTVVHGAESYVRGEDVVVFLQARADGRYMSMGLAWSKFTVQRRVDGAFAVRALDGLTLEVPDRVDPSTILLDEFRLDELEGTVEEALLEAAQ